MKRMPILTSGRTLVARGDLPMPADDDGSDWAAVAVVDVDRSDASYLGSYWASGYRGFLATGDVRHLAPFEGDLVAGLPLMTDPGLIEEFDEEFGQVDVAQIYEQGL